MGKCKFCGERPILLHDSESDSEVIYNYSCYNCNNRSRYSHSISETGDDWNKSNKKAKEAE